VSLGQRQRAGEVEPEELPHGRPQRGHRVRPPPPPRPAAQERAVEPVRLQRGHDRERYPLGRQPIREPGGAAVKQHPVEQGRVRPLAAEEAEGVGRRAGRHDKQDVAFTLIRLTVTAQVEEAVETSALTTGES